MGCSNVDILVEPIEGGTTLTSLVRIKREVEVLTGVSTDVLTPMARYERTRNAVLAVAATI